MAYITFQVTVSPTMIKKAIDAIGGGRMSYIGKANSITIPHTKGITPLLWLWRETTCCACSITFSASAASLGSTSMIKLLALLFLAYIPRKQLSITKVLYS